LRAARHGEFVARPIGQRFELERHRPISEAAPARPLRRDARKPRQPSLHRVRLHRGRAIDAEGEPTSAGEPRLHEAVERRLVGLHDEIEKRVGGRVFRPPKRVVAAGVAGIVVAIGMTGRGRTVGAGPSGAGVTRPREKVLHVIGVERVRLQGRAGPAAIGPEPGDHALAVEVAEHRIQRLLAFEHGLVAQGGGDLIGGGNGAVDRLKRRRAAVGIVGDILAEPREHRCDGGAHARARRLPRDPPRERHGVRL
jgi:hypothetical protein